MTTATFLLLLGFIHGTKNKTITIPKAVQIAGFGLLVFWAFSFFFKENQNIHEKTAFEKRQEELRRIYENPKAGNAISYDVYTALLEVDGWDIPDFGELYEMSTSQLLQLYKRFEKTGNRTLIDAIRDILLARYFNGEKLEFKDLVPPGVYTIVVIRTEYGFGCSVIESSEFFEEIVRSPYYMGAVDVSIDTDGYFELQGVFNAYLSRDVLERVVSIFMESIKFTNSKPENVGWTGSPSFPELPPLSLN